ncbi:hypothetical protein [Nocardioides antri]|uniref:Uncharacterized protein n=1 Tax=Nocardioides antri TaxID=2607659 RepID=A0A5B1M386_9ACTN|nr:hypothetical protein [Nocardioides antri]KAA1427675.1 hypothetical protein F0U47_09555 [Nocardioides antri]
MDAARKSWLITAATSVRTALTAGSLTLLMGLGAVSVLTAPQPPAEHLGLSGQDKATSRLLERNNCSTTGFNPEVIPTTAVIRDAVGRTRLVTFDEGWAVFNNERPGELVAVCLGRERTESSEPTDRTERTRAR